MAKRTSRDHSFSAHFNVRRKLFPEIEDRIISICRDNVDYRPEGTAAQQPLWFRVLLQVPSTARILANEIERDEKFGATLLSLCKFVSYGSNRCYYELDDEGLPCEPGDSGHSLRYVAYMTAVQARKQSERYRDCVSLMKSTFSMAWSSGCWDSWTATREPHVLQIGKPAYKNRGLITLVPVRACGSYRAVHVPIPLLTATVVGFMLPGILNIGYLGDDDGWAFSIIHQATEVLSRLHLVEVLNTQKAAILHLIPALNLGDDHYWNTFDAHHNVLPVNVADDSDQE